MISLAEPSKNTSPASPMGWQWGQRSAEGEVCWVGAMLWGQHSTAVPLWGWGLPNELGRLKGSRSCPLTAVALLFIPRVSETRPALALSTHSGAAALGHGRGTGTAAGVSLCPPLGHRLPLERWVTRATWGFQNRGGKSLGVPKCF